MRLLMRQYPPFAEEAHRFVATLWLMSVLYILVSLGRCVQQMICCITGPSVRSGARGNQRSSSELHTSASAGRLNG